MITTVPICYTLLEESLKACSFSNVIERFSESKCLLELSFFPEFKQCFISIGLETV